MDTKRRVNWRILMFALCVILGFSGLSMRMWWLQSVEAAKIMDYARSQWDWEKTLKPKRGAIMDRNGEILAYEGKAYTVNARLKPMHEKDQDYVKDPYYTATTLSRILGAPVDSLLKPLTNPKSKVVLLGRWGNKITEEQKKQIEQAQYPKLPSGEEVKTNQLPGIYLTETTRRFYPNNSFAAHVLGYLDFDDNPKMGLELQLDEQLRGEKGEMAVMTDGAGYQLPDGEHKYKPAQDGSNVYLTIDRQIQDYVEQALDIAERDFKPKGLMVVVSDPQTGEILAMGNRPQFNPNTYYNGITNFTNHAVTSMFEPGSTFKIITLAAAIEEGMFNPNEPYQSGTYTIKGQTPIRDHNNGRGWGKINFLEGVQRSSNVVFVIMGYERLKLEKLKGYFEKFGIGSITGIELPYEKKGNIANLENPRSPRDWAVTTFGQGVTVTAIQQIAAVGAIANGGELLKPRIIKEMRDPHTGAVEHRSEREVVRRVVSAATANQTRDILETVVTGEAGTGKSYKIEGYHVAGKTGTAQKYENGKLMDGHYIASFIGFAPKDNPRLLVYVVVDDPDMRDYTQYGGKIVAPIFKSIMERSLQYLQQQPDLKTVEGKDKNKKQAVAQQASLTPVKELTLPKFVDMATATAQMRAKQDELQVTVIGTGTKIVEQYPAPYSKVVSGQQIVLVTDRVQGTKMPDLTGKSLRDVMEFTSILHMQVKPTGVGFVAQQSIPPGTQLQGGETLMVTLKSESEPLAPTAPIDGQTEGPADTPAAGTDAQPPPETPPEAPVQSSGEVDEAGIPPDAGTSETANTEQSSTTP
ncbi:penicillin-binding protein [Brevibacillus invocatus]|uniref:penicillin-binding protein n=1 Tax=Brevibacillus invocatus TaxID=173959 RepID=UPI00203C004B|nr:PASTA domain-containing penicillin-binding protein [Brevibacillus invocatus]MCM3078442.1 penicillin-binding transpeptidase domain-containing protein [Brevibacillus invocatus]MCM3428403.1 penicillin-binding transpeptidase domain-containing protein [Brevibacillus invocatus]